MATDRLADSLISSLSRRAQILLKIDRLGEYHNALITTSWLLGDAAFVQTKGGTTIIPMPAGLLY